MSLLLVTSVILGLLIVATVFFIITGQPDPASVSALVFLIVAFVFIIFNGEKMQFVQKPKAVLEGHD